MGKLHIHLFGTLELCLGNDTCSHPFAPQARSFLAYLIYHHDRLIPRQRLLGVLWSKKTEGQARRGLSHTLWKIRQQEPLLDERLITEADTVLFQLLPGDFLDVEAFKILCRPPPASTSLTEKPQRLEETIAIYQADFLEDVYDDWVLLERGRLGMVGVLHTWGRNLSYHPHVHYVVPGGGLTADGTWQPARKNFLLPVKALSQVFRAKFRDALRQQAPELFAEIPVAVWEKAWVVHSQPVGRGLRALKYLAPYIFRVAISNRRIERLQHGKVLFRYRKSDTGTFRTCRLPAAEFLRRFLQHVLPKGFVKVRYYGFLAPGCRPLLVRLHQQLGSLATEQPAATAGADAVEPTTEPNAPGQPEVRCPTCGHPMQRRALPPVKSRPRGRCPPPI